jgi:hypothetical protein
MDKAGSLHLDVNPSLSAIPWEERLEDHNNKIKEYLQNRLFRGCAFETTVESSRRVLQAIFKRVEMDDPSHPLGKRPIVFWEFMDPERGPSRLGTAHYTTTEQTFSPSHQTQVQE